jgi:hypothetical protein
MNGKTMSRLQLNVILTLTLTLMMSSTTLLAEAIPVEIVERDGSFVLLRGGEPYEVRGAGLEFSDPAGLAARGGNSMRTWRTDNAQFTGRELLDEAERLGMTVTMCIEIGRERQGFDYDDEEAVAKQFEYAKGEVLKYKDHPALLAWMIGNEPNLQARNTKVYDAINDISKMIHEVDGKHPTTTALAGFGPELAEITRKQMSDLDFISVQFYGDIVNLPRYLDRVDWDKPYMVTEWGALGHWEVKTTKWGAPIEQSSSEKAAHYRKSHEIAISSDKNLLIGNYVFLWGQKQERTPTWYGMFLKDGSRTGAVDVMQRVWTGEWPANRSPDTGGMRLNGKAAEKNIKLKPGGSYEASVEASDPDGDTLQFTWEIMAESNTTATGGDKEYVPETIETAFSGNGAEVEFKAPTKPGPYRLFVYVHDGQGNAGHANIPFRVR